MTRISALYVESESCFLEIYLCSRKHDTNAIRKVENEREAAFNVRAAFSQSGWADVNSFLIDDNCPSNRLK